MQFSGVGIRNLFRPSYIRIEYGHKISGLAAFKKNMQQWAREMIPTGDFPWREEVLVGDKVKTSGLAVRSWYYSWGRLLTFWGLPSLTNLFLLSLAIQRNFATGVLQPGIPFRIRASVYAVYILTPILLCIDMLWFGVFFALKLIQAATVVAILALAAIAEALDMASKKLFEYSQQHNSTFVKILGFMLFSLSFVAHGARAFLQQVFQPIERARIMFHEVTEYCLDCDPESFAYRHAQLLGRIAGLSSFIISLGLTIALFFTPIGWSAIGKGLSTFISKFSSFSIMPVKNVANFFSFIPNIFTWIPASSAAMASEMQNAAVTGVQTVLTMKLLPDIAISLFHSKPINTKDKMSKFTAPVLSKKEKAQPKYEPEIPKTTDSEVENQSASVAISSPLKSRTPSPVDGEARIDSEPLKSRTPSPVNGEARIDTEPLKSRTTPSPVDGEARTDSDEEDQTGVYVKPSLHRVGTGIPIIKGSSHLMKGVNYHRNRSNTPSPPILHREIDNNELVELVDYNKVHPS